jgi:hypothetical protein
MWMLVKLFTSAIYGAWHNGKYYEVLDTECNLSVHQISSVLKEKIPTMNYGIHLNIKRIWTQTWVFQYFKG